MYRRLFLILFLSVVSRVSFAQHYDTWERITLRLPVNSKWLTEAEFQSRQQNKLDHISPLGAPLMYSYRQWIYYRASAHVQFALSPFAYYRAYTTILQQTDYYKAPGSEYRFSAAAEMQQPLSKSLWLNERAALEYRLFEGADDIIRLRTRLGLRKDAGQHWAYKVYYELMLNTWGISRAHLYDQSRFSFSMSYRTHHRFELEPGYMYLNRLSKTAKLTINEHAFFINLFYSFR